MADWWWSWLLAGVGLTGLWLAGSRRATGWAIGIGVQVLWIAYGVAADQWGFIASALGYGAVNTRNLLRWLRETRPHPTQTTAPAALPTVEDYPMPAPALGAGLLARALAVFPADPTRPHAPETITDYELVVTPATTRDPCVPERYWSPVIDDALPLARKVTAAVLRAVADLHYDTAYPDAMVPPPDQLRRIAYQIERGDVDPPPPTPTPEHEENL